MFKILLISKDLEKSSTDCKRARCAEHRLRPYTLLMKTWTKPLLTRPLTSSFSPSKTLTASPIIETVRELRRERPIPILALISKDALQKSRDIAFAVDDFAIEPCESEEIAFRVKKALKETYAVDSKDLIRSNDLVIDLSRREVTLAGTPLSLTFTEYELLVFLAANSGRVFTREALLNKIWGYDYYGGDRTVDVHIRRLRSKIDWGQHSFIETVRGMGYRFKEHA